MKTYITEHKHTKEWGKRILANTWEEAEIKCPKDYIVKGQLVKEGFINLGDLKYNVMNFVEKKKKYKTDTLTNAYIIGITLLFLYIAYRAMKK